MFGFAKYPTPVLKPLWPFFVGGAITYYLVGKAAAASMNTGEFYNDPRNPRFKAGQSPEH